MCPVRPRFPGGHDHWAVSALSPLIAIAVIVVIWQIIIWFQWQPDDVIPSPRQVWEALGMIERVVFAPLRQRTLRNRGLLRWRRTERPTGAAATPCAKMEP